MTVTELGRERERHVAMLSKKRQNSHDESWNLSQTHFEPVLSCVHSGVCLPFEILGAVGLANTFHAKVSKSGPTFFVEPHQGSL